MKLIGSLASPYVRKTRITALEKGLDLPMVLDNVWGADTAIQKTNPLGKVPCLVLDDGSAVYDSRVICEYLDGLSATTPLIPAAGPMHLVVRRWEALADGVTDAIVLVRLEETQREPAGRSAKWVERQMGKVTAGIAAMADGLGKGHWCVGGSISLADICVGTVLGYIEFRYAQVPWRAQHPNLASHYDKLMQRPSFSTTLPK